MQTPKQHYHALCVCVCEKSWIAIYCLLSLYFRATDRGGKREGDTGSRWRLLCHFQQIVARQGQFPTPDCCTALLSARLSGPRYWICLFRVAHVVGASFLWGTGPAIPTGRGLCKLSLMRVIFTFNWSCSCSCVLGLLLVWCLSWAALVLWPPLHVALWSQRRRILVFSSLLPAVSFPVTFSYLELLSCNVSSLLFFLDVAVSDKPFLAAFLWHDA